MVFRKEIELEQSAIKYFEEKEYEFSWHVPLHNRVVDLGKV